MNRFFSKLNLADIKIKAEGNSFPPDADEELVDEIEETIAETESPVAPLESAAEAVVEYEEVAVYVETETTSVESNGYTEWETTTATVEYAPASSNGYVTEIISEDIVIGLEDVLKVSARSRPSAVAGAIAGVVREVGRAEVQAIGAGATNQAIKAVAIARDYLKETGIDAICIPAFIDVTIENEDRTAIRLVVEPR